MALMDIAFADGLLRDPLTGKMETLSSWRKRSEELAETKDLPTPCKLYIHAMLAGDGADAKKQIAAVRQWKDEHLHGDLRPLAKWVCVVFLDLRIGTIGTPFMKLLDCRPFLIEQFNATDRATITHASLVGLQASLTIYMNVALSKPCTLEDGGFYFPEDEPKMIKFQFRFKTPLEPWFHAFGSAKGDKLVVEWTKHFDILPVLPLPIGDGKAIVERIAVSGISSSSLKALCDTRYPSADVDSLVIDCLKCGEFTVTVPTKKRVD